MNMPLTMSAPGPCCETQTKARELCGCANGVAWAKLVVMDAVNTNEKWMNLETGEVSATKPPGWLAGPCTEAVAKDVLKFSATDPTATAPFASPKDGDTTIVTSDGTEDGTVVSYWRFDKETETWKEIPLPSEDTLVGLTPALTDGTLVATFTTLGGEEIEVFAPDPVAMINDDQVLTGAADTNVALTFTPTTVPDPENPDVNQVNYVIGASAKIDGVTIVENPTTKVLSAVPPASCCVPAGGTDGQVLTKQPNGSFAWETPAEVGTTEVADGTTITGDGSAAEPFEVANPVPTGGTEGQVLSVNSSGALVWTTPPAVTSPRFVAYTFAGGETEITLPSVPVGENEAGGTVDPGVGIVHVSRNGVDISHAWTWDGAVGTYDPALNLNCTIDEDDVLQFHWEAAV